MECYHLSHTDLDGYTCQYIASKYFKNIKFFNANYGLEVGARLQEIVTKIERSKKKEFYILITDLNLSIDEGKTLTQEVEKLRANKKNITLQLLDHHGSGKACAEMFAWYYLDTSRSATKITYDFFREKFAPKNENAVQKIAELVEAVNAIDIWQEHEPLFEFGKVCMRMINGSNELSRIIFDEENRRYRFALLEKSIPFLRKEDAAIKLDNALHKLKKQALKTEKEDDIIDNIISKKVTHLLAKNKEHFTIYYKDKVGILTYALGSISVIANLFLRKNTEFDFFIDIGPKGNCSLRSNNKVDVSVLSKELFGGGGHPNASGGRIEGFKESFLYDEVKLKLLEIIKEKTNG